MVLSLLHLADLHSDWNDTGAREEAVELTLGLGSTVQSGENHWALVIWFAVQLGPHKRKRIYFQLNII